MAEAVNVHIDLSQLRAKLIDIRKKASEALPVMADVGISNIKTALAQGTRPSLRGQMPPLSKPYYKRKMSFLGVGIRDYTLHGDMLGSMQYFPFSDHAGEINVSAEEYPKALGNSLRAPFLEKSKVMTYNMKQAILPMFR